MKLELKDICVSYDTEVVLKNLSLSVREGEFLSLLGPSGCGKSTLLKTVAGIVPVAEGSVFLDGGEITQLPVHRRGTVVVFQDMRLFPHMSVADNVAFPLKMQGVDKRKRLETALEMLNKVQMEKYARRLPGELSGGQQQRVALARALAAAPKLLLLDEPFSALDENLREDMRNLVLQLHREFGMTTILVTHDREEALSMSDRVAVMSEGRILQLDTPETVYHRPTMAKVADFFGGCAYVSGTVRNGEFRSEHLHFPVGCADGEYSLLLRSHNFCPETHGSYPVTVEAVRFRGKDTEVTFRGEDGLVWKKTYAENPAYQPGQRLSAALNPGDPVLFPID